MSPRPTASRSWIERALLLLLAVNLALLFYYIVVDYGYTLHSDSAAKNLLAQEIYDTGEYFPRDWNYVNGDLWVLYVHTLILPLLPFLPNGYGLHAFAGLTTALLVLLGTWCLADMAGLSRRARLAALVLLACGMSPNMAENLYGQAGYGFMYAMGAFLLYSQWRGLHAAGRRRALWLAASAVLAVLVFWANPQRAAVYYGLPSGLALLAMLALPTLRRVYHVPHGGAIAAPPAGALLRCVAVLVIAALAGAALHGYTLRQVNSTAGLSVANWLSFDNMVRNAQGTVQGLLSLLAGLPDSGMSILKGRSAALALRLLAGLTLLLLLPWGLLGALRLRHPGRLFLAVATCVALGVCLLINVATTIPVQNSPEASIRYLVPALLGALVLLCGRLFDDSAAPTDRAPAPRRRALLGAALATLGVTGAAAYAVPLSPRYFKRGEGMVLNPHRRLADFLHANGLLYGYATFWSAGRYTVQSGQAVRVRQVEMKNGMLTPFYHLASDRWYQPEAWQGQSFLLLGSEEIHTIDWARIKAEAGKPLRELTFEGWHIFVYPQNLAQLLPAWDRLARRPTHYRMIEQTPHTTGAFDAARGEIASTPGKDGMLTFGQQRRLLPGRYQASFDIETEGAAGADGYGWVDVVSNGGTVLVRQQVSQTGPQRVPLTFTLQRRAIDIEFRTYTNGAGRFAIRNIEVVAAG